MNYPPTMTIRIQDVQGQAWRIDENGQRILLRPGDTVTPNTRIITGPGSQVTVADAEGTPYQLGPDAEHSFGVFADGSWEMIPPTTPTPDTGPLSAQLFTNLALLAREPALTARDGGGSSSSEGGHRGGTAGGSIEPSGANFVRLPSVVEPVVPLALAYPRPTTPRPEIPRMGAVVDSNTSDTDTTPTQPARPELHALVTIHPVTRDSILDAEEVHQRITLTGSTGGDVRPGDTVVIEIGSHSWSVIVQGDNSWSLEVPGALLSRHDTVRATVEVRDDAGNTARGSAETSYVLTETPPPAGIYITELIPADGDTPGKVRGDVTGQVQPGDPVRVTVGGNEYVTTVRPDYTWEVDVPGLPAGPEDLRVSVVTQPPGQPPLEAEYLYPFTPTAEPPSVIVDIIEERLTEGETSEVTFTFSKPPVGFTPDDLVVTGGTVIDLRPTDDPLVWTGTFVPTPGHTGESSVRVPDGSFTDDTGLPGIGSSDTVPVLVPPSVIVDIIEERLIEGETSEVTFTFSKPPVGFTPDDLVVTGGTVTDLRPTNDPLVWTGTFVPTPGHTGESSVRVPDGSFTDDTGLPGIGSRDTVPVLVPPSVIVDIVQDLLVDGATSEVTFTFSERPVGFTLEDVTVEGGTLSQLQPTNNPNVWTAVFTPTPGLDGSGKVSVTPGSYTNELGLPGSGDDDTVLIDVSPSVIVDIVRDLLIEGETSEVTFTFTEPPVGFTPEDLIVTGGTVSQLQPTSNPNVWTGVFTPNPSYEGGGSVAVRDGSYTNQDGRIGTGHQDTVAVDTRISATIEITSIAGDDFLDDDEYYENVPITGVVGGDVKAGDIVTLTIGSQTFTTPVVALPGGGLGFTALVPGHVLGSLSLSEHEVHASVTASDPAGNRATATHERPYTLDEDVAPRGTPGPSIVHERGLDDGSAPDTDDINHDGALNLLPSQHPFETRFDSDTITALEAVGLTQAGVPLTFALSPDGLSVTASAGSDTVFVIRVIDADTPEASYRVELVGPIDHDQGDNAQFNVPLTVTSTGTGTGSTTLQLPVTITDDVPVAEDQEEITLTEGGIVSSESGGTNLISGAPGTDDGDRPGADGARVSSIQYRDSQGDLQTAVVPNNATGVTVTTQFGELTVRADGTWSYQSRVSEHGAPDSDTDTALSESFQYQLTDRDGSTSNWANQPLVIEDTVPTLDDPIVVAGTVYEASLPTGTTPGEAGQPVTATGLLGVQPNVDTVLTTFPANPGVDYLTGLTAGGQPLTYTLSPDGTTLQAFVNGSTPVFTVTITDGDSSDATYTFTLHSPIDHIEDEPLQSLNIPFVVTDGDGDQVSGTLQIVVQDDPPLQLQTEMTVLEDSNQSGATPPANELRTPAEATRDNLVLRDENDQPLTPIGSSGDALHTYKTPFGTVFVKADGTLVYTPDENFRGEDAIHYTYLQGGQPAERTISVTVLPVADAPDITVTDVSGDEDTRIALSLTAPAITDDQPATGATNDHPERLGVLTLSGFPAGAKVYLNTTDADTETLPLVNGTLTVVIVDTEGSTTPSASYHHADITTDASTVFLTLAQFQGLHVLPPADSHANFDLTLSATSYEVDANRVPLKDADDALISAPNSDTFTVDVRAVTDEPTLTLDDSNLPSGVTVDNTVPDAPRLIASFPEDDTITLTDVFQHGFGDTDGSEQYWYDITGLPPGSTVTLGGIDYTADASGQLRDADGATPAAHATTVGTNNPQPTITITPPPNWAGQLDDLKIVLNVQDRDSDSPGHTPSIETSEIALSITVTPVAGDVDIDGITMNEDTVKAFLTGIVITDTDDTPNGAEHFTGLVIAGIPADWILLDKDGNPLTTRDGAGNPEPRPLAGGITITVDADGKQTLTLSGPMLDNDAEGAPNFHGLQIQPPAHSSEDLKVTVTATTKDVLELPDGSTLEDTEAVTKELTLVTVRPVAESIPSDSPNPAGEDDGDLRMTLGHRYTTHGEEDSAMALGSDGSFELADRWYNVDDVANGGREETYAELTPYANPSSTGAFPTTAFDGLNPLFGSTFSYQHNGQTVTVVFDGTPVRVPVEALDSVTFQGPAHFKGSVAIRVQAHTKDFDDDGGTEAVTSTSGEAWLTNVIIHPKADQVTVNLNARLTGNEDAGRDPVTDAIIANSGIPLVIRPQSDDPDETFDMVIDATGGMPAGVAFSYWGQVFALGAMDANAGIPAGSILQAVTDPTALGLYPGDSNGEASKLLAVSANGETSYVYLHDGKLHIVNYQASPEGSPAFFLVPPLDSNAPIELQVSASTVDALTYFDENTNQTTTVVSRSGVSTPLQIDITVRGVPDEPALDLVHGNSDDPAGAPRFVEDGAENQNTATGLSVPLSALISGYTSGETANDGSETLTLRISGLPAGFELVGAGYPLSGSGESRVWVLTQDQVTNGTVSIRVPANYSGELTFQATPVVTENDNAARTFPPQDVSFQVAPRAEATVATSSQLNEDEPGRVNLSLVAQHGDTNETLVTAWVQNNGTEAYTLWLRTGGTDANPTLISLADAAAQGSLGVSAETVGGAGGYRFTPAALEQLYAQAGPNVSGNNLADHQLTVHYTVRDTVAEGNTGAAWQTHTRDGSVTHQLQVAPVTDPFDLELNTGAVQNGTWDGAERTANVTAAGTVTLTLDLAKQNDPAAGGAPDHDGSERVTRIIIDGLPDGVIVEGAHATGNGQWVIYATDTFSGGVGLNLPVTLRVSGHTAQDTYRPTITVVTQDGTAAEERESLDFVLNVDFAPGDPEPLPELKLTPTGAGLGEDASRSLGSLVTANLTDVPGAQTDFLVTVTLRNPPEGVTLAGFTSTLVQEGGEWVTLWSITQQINGTDVADAQAQLNSWFNSVMLQAPEHWNDNNHPGGLPLDLTVALHTQGARNVDSLPNLRIGVTPESDQATVALTAPSQEEGEDIAITVQLSNAADQDDWVVLDNKLYLSLDAGTLNGTLLDAQGQPLTLTPVSGVTNLPPGNYYVVTLNSPTDAVQLSFRPNGEFDSGSVVLHTYALTYELNSVGGSAAPVLSHGQTALTIVPTNSGFNGELSASGQEHTDTSVFSNAIELTRQGADGKPFGLLDSKETISAARLEGVPDGFVVLYGADAASAQLAHNAGGSGSLNMWSLPLQGGALPAYIAVLPPSHWSGTLDSMNLTVQSGEAGQAPTASVLPFSLSIDPVANGATLKPTLSFGKAGDLITFNLNAAMVDPVDVRDGDAFSERAEIRVSGLADGVVFYLADGSAVPLGPLASPGDAQVVRDGADYVLSGLTQSDLDTLRFMSPPAANSSLTVSISTYEVDADGNVAEVNGVEVRSDSTSANMTINVSSQLPTTGNDTLYYDGTLLDGGAGTDTVIVRDGVAANLGQLRNVEVVQLQAGATLTGLTPAQVAAAAGGASKVLQITGTGEVDLQAAGSGRWGLRTGSTDTYEYRDGTTVLATLQLVGVTVADSSGPMQPFSMMRMSSMMVTEDDDSVSDDDGNRDDAYDSSFHGLLAATSQDEAEEADSLYTDSAYQSGTGASRFASLADTDDGDEGDDLSLLLFSAAPASAATADADGSTTSADDASAQPATWQATASDAYAQEDELAEADGDTVHGNDDVLNTVASPLAEGDLTHLAGTNDLSVLLERMPSNAEDASEDQRADEIEGQPTYTANDTASALAMASLHAYDSSYAQVLQDGQRQSQDV